MVYDDDGNMTSEAFSGYDWNAENRLIEWVPFLDLFFVTEGARKITYDYDYMGRMVRRRVYGQDGQEWSGTPSSDQRYVYDGWRMIEELDGMNSNVVTLQFTWGLDLAGQNGASRAVPGPGSLPGLGGAGGIGGLLAMHKNEGAAPGDIDPFDWFHIPNPDAADGLYFYNANGDVSQLIDVTTGVSSDQDLAAYEYYPYGGEWVAEGPFKYINPFRFSTKYWDPQAQTLYYGYRWLKPYWGRWLSRDPAAEDGGLNLFCFVNNSPSTLFDPLGEWPSISPINDHETLTTKSFDDVSNLFDFSRPCRSTIVEYLVVANVGQDGGAAFDLLSRHYNRPGGSSNKAGWDDLYGQYIRHELANFRSLVAQSECKDSLSSLGRVAHAWQDFFAHAIRRDGKGGIENSAHPGWVAWSNTPRVAGDPDNRSNFWPSSYPGEHPLLGEPLTRHSPEYESRWGAARIYLASRLRELLPAWEIKCSCWCEREAKYLGN